MMVFTEEEKAVLGMYKAKGRESMIRKMEQAVLFTDDDEALEILSRCILKADAMSDEEFAAADLTSRLK